MMITESAAEALQQARTERGLSLTAGLRISVVSGGCAGHQYIMEFSEPQASDTSSSKGDITVYIAESSLPYLQDAELDYVDSLTDAGYRINNRAAARTCGCGTSFEPVSGQPMP